MKNQVIDIYKLKWASSFFLRESMRFLSFLYKEELETNLPNNNFSFNFYININHVLST